MKELVSLFLIISVLSILTSCSELIGFREASPEAAPAQTKSLPIQESPKRHEFLPPETEKVSETEIENIETSSALLPEEVFAEISSSPAGTILTDEKLEAVEIDDLFTKSEIDDDLLERINGISYRENPNISTANLVYLRMLHKNADGQTLIGEMIVNSAVGDEILSIFRQLYDGSYPIERMVLIDEYGGDDELSMEANNTSAFNCRQITGSTALSNHSYGMAIDINPLYNPYINGSVILPEGAEAYTDRNADSPYIIKEGDLCHELFVANGYSWGGYWKTPIDYQHFEKIVN